jgi:hypothetical protein
MTIDGRRIAVEVTAMKRRAAERVGPAKPRLRFDRVVLRLIGRLQAALFEAVPAGQAVILTVTAPIRLPSKTAAALETMIRACLERRSAQADIGETVCGNQVRIRVVNGVSTKMSRVIAFVHNPETHPELLLRETQALAQHIGAIGERRSPGSFSGERWLVVANQNGLPQIETYRQIYSQFALSTDVAKTLVVLPGERVETLAG